MFSPGGLCLGCAAQGLSLQGSRAGISTGSQRTLCFIIVLKWLLRKKTLSSSSFTAAVSSHSPWYVSWEAVDSRNCSAISPAGGGDVRAGPGRP